MYELIYDTEAVEALQKLPHATRKRIVDKLSSIKAHPYRYCKKLEGRPDFALRIGNYRAILDIDKSRRRIAVLLVGHRRSVYD